MSILLLFFTTGIAIKKYNCYLSHTKIVSIFKFTQCVLLRYKKDYSVSCNNKERVLLFSLKLLIS